MICDQRIDAQVRFGRGFARHWEARVRLFHDSGDGRALTRFGDIGLKPSTSIQDGGAGWVPSLIRAARPQI